MSILTDYIYATYHDTLNFITTNWKGNDNVVATIEPNVINNVLNQKANELSIIGGNISSNSNDMVFRGGCNCSFIHQDKAYLNDIINTPSFLFNRDSAIPIGNLYSKELVAAYTELAIPTN